MMHLLVCACMCVHVCVYPQEASSYNISINKIDEHGLVNNRSCHKTLPKKKKIYAILAT